MNVSFDLAFLYYALVLLLSTVPIGVHMHQQVIFQIYISHMFMFLWILFLTKYDKIMSYDELKCAQKEVFCKISKFE